MDDAQPFAGIEVVQFGQCIAHPALGGVRVLAPPVRLDGDGFRPGAATASFGSETRALLGSLGFGKGEIDTLLAERVTAERFEPRRAAPRTNGDR